MNSYPDYNSVIDTLKSNDYKSDFNTRKYLYENTYGGNYTGSSDQNIRMNKDLHSLFVFYF